MILFIKTMRVFSFLMAFVTAVFVTIYLVDNGMQVKVLTMIALLLSFTVFVFWAFWGMPTMIRNEKTIIELKRIRDAYVHDLRRANHYVEDWSDIQDDEGKRS